ncbi:MAG: hypothetical protein AAGA17_02870 [Actinomycetota bacterium]
MLIGCWSPKGGSGTSVVAAALALGGSPSLLIDGAGELDAVLGITADGPGVRGWLSSAAIPPPDALGRLEVPVADGVGLVPSGPAIGARPAPGRASLLADLLRGDDRVVVVDVGAADDEAAGELLLAADLRLCVLRPCYLAARRLQASSTPVDGLVLVDEPGRSLRADDLAGAAGVPVVGRVPWDPAIARAVDAGVLATRQPRVLMRAARRLLELDGARR